MEAHRWIGGGERLLLAQLLAAQVDRVAHDSVAQVPEVHTDLVGAAGAGQCLDDRLAVAASRENAEGGFGGVARLSVDDAKTVVGGPAGDRLAGDGFVPGRMARHAAEIGF